MVGHRLVPLVVGRARSVGRRGAVAGAGCVPEAQVAVRGAVLRVVVVARWLSHICQGMFCDSGFPSWVGQVHVLVQVALLNRSVSGRSLLISLQRDMLIEWV